MFLFFLFDPTFFFYWSVGTFIYPKTFFMILARILLDCFWNTCVLGVFFVVAVVVLVVEWSLQWIFHWPDEFLTSICPLAVVILSLRRKLSGALVSLPSGRRSGRRSVCPFSFGSSGKYCPIRSVAKLQWLTPPPPTTHTPLKVFFFDSSIDFRLISNTFPRICLYVRSFRTSISSLFPSPSAPFCLMQVSKERIYLISRRIISLVKRSNILIVGNSPSIHWSIQIELFHHQRGNEIPSENFWSIHSRFKT